MTIEPDPDDPFEPAFPRYYDRQGNRISLKEWSRTYDPEHIRVAEDYVPIPSGDVVRVSTVWLGLDHNYSRDGVPLIFETATFPSDGDVQIWARYSTEESARTGHALCVSALATGLEEP